MRILIGLMGLVFSTSAFAHTGHGDASGLIHGFMHPVSGIDHVLAMVAVGVLAFVTGGRARFALPLPFMAAMLAGGALGMSGFELPMVEAGIGASVVVIAGLAAFGAVLPLWPAATLVAFFGIFHGFSHGAEMPADASGLAYAAGFFVATGLLHLTGFAAGFGAVSLFGKNGRLAARIGSGAMALAGIAVLGGAV
jgi:urease accessory protein